MFDMDLHESAMLFYEKGLVAARNNDESATVLFNNAYALELPVAQNAEDSEKAILYLSAASMALCGGMIRNALMCAHEGLNYNPDDHIKCALTQIIRGVH